MQTIPDPVQSLLDSLCEEVEREDLDRPTRLKVIATLRRRAIPKENVRRRSSPRIDQAYADHKSGMRGAELFQKHIPHYPKLSRWRRQIEERRLTKTIAKRAERERKRQSQETKDGLVATTL